MLLVGQTYRKKISDPVLTSRPGGPLQRYMTLFPTGILRRQNGPLSIADVGSLNILLRKGTRPFARACRKTRNNRLLFQSASSTKCKGSSFHADTHQN